MTEHVTSFRYIEGYIPNHRNRSGQSATDPVTARLFIEKLAQKVRREAHRVKGFVRFHQYDEDCFLALINPRYDVLPLVRHHFEARFADKSGLSTILAEITVCPTKATAPRKCGWMPRRLPLFQMPPRAGKPLLKLCGNVTTPPPISGSAKTLVCKTECCPVASGGTCRRKPVPMRRFAHRAAAP